VNGDGHHQQWSARRHPRVGDESNLEESLSAFRQARAVDAVARPAVCSIAQGRIYISMAEIDAEINDVRQGALNEDRPRHQRARRRTALSVRTVREIVRMVSSGELNEP